MGLVSLESLRRVVKALVSKISKVSEQTELNKSAVGFQKKNLLKNQCQRTTLNGVTLETNSDGSITITGTNTLSSNFVAYWNMQTGAINNLNQFKDNKKWFKNGKYYLSGGTTKAGVQIRLSESDNSEGRGIECTGTQRLIEITDADQYVWTRIKISSNADFGEGERIYPMLRYAEIDDDTYEPYVDDVQTQIQQLVERISALENKLKD